MRRFLIFFAATTAIALIPAAGLSLYFQPLEGDLTRIGAYSERDFGWNAVHPVVHISQNGKSLPPPDMLVLGDSFSEHNIWQSILARQIHKKILSFRFDQVRCMDSWLDFALHHPSANTIVIETVERNILERMRDLSCKGGGIRPFELAGGSSDATRSIWPPELRISQTFRAAAHTIKMELRPDATFDGNVINAPIDRTCAKFSNLRADRMLYYPTDREKLRWTPADQRRVVANVMLLQRLFAERGKKLIFIVVPDKLSVYQDCLLSDPERSDRKLVNITQALIGAGANTPDLLDDFRKKIGEVVDLYNPNNTHLSESGYALMASAIAPLANAPALAVRAGKPSH